MYKPIYLIGARASGKTTVGRRLAEALGLAFIDTDEYMHEKYGQTVSESVERLGWEGFRQREGEALREVSGSGKVIATGGGMVLAECNRTHMRGTGRVFYLCAPADVLAERLLRNPAEAQRPSLTGGSIIEEMEEVLAQREPLYRDACHHAVDAAGDVDAVVKQLLEWVEKEEE